MYQNTLTSLTKWKRWSLWLTALLLMVVVSGCGSQPDEVALSKQAPPRRGAVDVLAQVQEITAETLGVSEDVVVENADFRQDLGADDDKIASLADALQKTFDITLTAEEVGGLTTVQSAVDLIKSKQ